MKVKFGDVRDFICRECGLYGMVDVIAMEFEYHADSGALFDIIDDPDGRHRGDQIICDCGCAVFDMHIQHAGN
ncbi:hypothetical protein MASR1M90_11090 [Desulfovibrionales bacterium]